MLRSLWKATAFVSKAQVAIGAVAFTTLILTSTMPLIGLFWRTSFSSSHETFWSDMEQHLTEDEKTLSEEELRILYGDDVDRVVHDQLGSVFGPSERLATLGLLTLRETEQNVPNALLFLGAALLGMFWLTLWILRVILRAGRAEEDDDLGYAYFSDRSGEAWVSSAAGFCIVAILSYLSAGSTLDESWRSVGVTRWHLTVFYIGVAHSSGFWVLLAKLAVAVSMLSEGVDPRETFKDDLAAAGLILPLLLLAGNSVVAIAAATAAAIAPEVLVKLLRRSRRLRAALGDATPATPPPSGSVQAAFGFERMAMAIGGLLLFGAFCFSGYLTWQGFKKHRVLMGEAPLRNHIFRAYQKDDRRIPDRIWQRLEAVGENSSRALAAVAWAWRGDAKRARALLQTVETLSPDGESSPLGSRPAREEAEVRVDLLLGGASVVRTERIAYLLRTSPKSARAGLLPRLRALPDDELARLAAERRQRSKRPNLVRQLAAARAFQRRRAAAARARQKATDAAKGQGTR